MTRLRIAASYALDAILARLSNWHHRRQAVRGLDARIRATMAEEAWQRQRDRDMRAQFNGECD